MLITKDLVFKEKPAKKLVDQYISLYIIDEVVSTNVVKLQLLTLMWIHPVVNISQVVQYREQVEGVEEWKVEKYLNKIKIRGIVKYLVQQKGFMAEHDIQEKEKDLESTKKVVAERMNAEVR